MNRILISIIALVVCLFIIVFGIQYAQWVNDYHEAGGHAQAIGDMLVSAFSSASGVGTFSVALYAAINVKDWLSPKVRDKGFERTQQLLTDMYELKHLALDVASKVSNVINTNPENQLSDESYKNKWQDVSNTLQIYEEKSNYFRSSFESLIHWGITLKTEKLFKNIISNHFSLHDILQDSLSFDINDKSLRGANSLEYGLPISLARRKLHKSYDDVKKPYTILFEYH